MAVKKKAKAKTKDLVMKPGLPSTKSAKQKVQERKPIVGRSGRLKQRADYEVG